MLIKNNFPLTYFFYFYQTLKIYYHHTTFSIKTDTEYESQPRSL